jgi:uncharacterized protein (TIGR02266 family)
MGQWRRAAARDDQADRRVPTAVAVRVTTVDAEIDPDSGTRFFRSVEETTANLSQGGAFVHSWEPLEPGRRVVLALDLDSGDELQLAARVVWTRRRLRGRTARDLEPPGFGLEFVDTSARERRTLDRLLQVRAQTSGDEARSESRGVRPAFPPAP